MVVRLLLVLVLLGAWSQAWAETVQLRDVPSFVSDKVGQVVKGACVGSGFISYETPVERLDADGDGEPDYIVRLPPAAGDCLDDVRVVSFLSTENYTAAPAATPPAGVVLSEAKAEEPADDAPAVAEAVSVGSAAPDSDSPAAESVPEEAATTATEAAEERPSNLAAGTAFGIAVVVVVGLIGAIVAGMMAIARHTFQTHGYRVFANWWNVLYLPIVMLLLFSGPASELGGAGGFVALAIPAGALWLIRVFQNVRKTSFGLGLTISVVQLIGVGVIALALIVHRASRNAQRDRELGISGV